MYVSINAAHNVFGTRIYYSLQKETKKDYNLTKYFNAKKKLEKHEQFMFTLKDWKRTYRGKETKNFNKWRELKEELSYYDNLRAIDYYNDIEKIKGKSYLFIDNS